MPLRFVYADGSARDDILLCEDWYADIEDPYRVLRSEVVPVINNLDRICGDVFSDVNEVAIFEISLPVDPTRELVAFVLETDGASYAGDLTRFNLFAATGIRLGEQ